ncbi:carbohydrate kinase [Pseudarthrobacter sp. NamE2]|uniref:carbohydrate kinase family protein n=1 Tax=Pseudarthrobacter sp. NamE2 TaxID=2576838 RepID=UPI0010FDCC39|nr:carbohydrate kinase [Pseudarthrobacter sp. NamE2]TLM81696.1 carbohydrate kinase [Pseudarthrobacter sp. NamE2]
MPAVEHTAEPTQGFDVVVVGEALMDIVVSSAGTVEHPGGSPANVAYGLGRLGVATGLLTSIGDDLHAASIERQLGSAGVELLPGSARPGRTATATATLASDGSAQYDFDIRWDLPRVAPATLPKILHTGSIATFLAPGAAVVRELLEQSHQRCMVTYDPNIRPALLGSQEEAVAIFEELVPFTEVVKLSDEDACWLYPRLSLDEVSQRVLGLGAELVAVTRGGEGSLLTTRAAQVAVPAVPSAVVDTIGAGDSYMSALIYGLLMRGADGLAPSVLESLGRMAAKAAAITVRRAGAQPPSLEELRDDLAEHLPVAP